MRVKLAVALRELVWFVPFIILWPVSRWHSLAVVLACLLPWAVGAAWRFYRKAAIYDSILTFIHDDIAVNLRHFERMRTSAILANEPEIQEAHRVMMVMGKRLNEISLRMEEATGLSLRPKPVGPPPVVY
jgi:hypothetical protein